MLIPWNFHLGVIKCSHNFSMLAYFLRQVLYRGQHNSNTSDAGLGSSLLPSGYVYFSLQSISRISFTNTCYVIAPLISIQILNLVHSLGWTYGTYVCISIFDWLIWFFCFTFLWCKGDVCYWKWMQKYFNLLKLNLLIFNSWWNHTEFLHCQDLVMCLHQKKQKMLYILPAPACGKVDWLEQVVPLLCLQITLHIYVNFSTWVCWLIFTGRYLERITCQLKWGRMRVKCASSL